MGDTRLCVSRHPHAIELTYTRAVSPELLLWTPWQAEALLALFSSQFWFLLSGVKYPHICF